VTTFALIHGGNYTSACWQRLTPLLDGDVLLIDLPGRNGRLPAAADLTLADNVAAVIEDLRAAAHPGEDVVLVGHSVAGITVAHVVNEAPQLVGRVVLLSCTIPPHGSAVLDHIDPDVRESVLSGARGGAFVLDEATARLILCNDMDPEQTAFTLAHMVEDANAVLVERVDLTGLRSGVPVTYVRLGEDATLPPARQDHAIAALGEPDVARLDGSGHMAMISHPTELAAVLHEVAGR